MYTAEFEGINTFLVESCKLLKKEAVVRLTRGEKCYELPEPYMFKITNPYAREITIPARRWNHYLPYAESLWMASGRNDMAFVRHYLANLDDYSDNGETMRGGYGPRFRHYNGLSYDYDVRYLYAERTYEVDQFRYIIECFKQDINTRRGIITIGDPLKDCFDNQHRLKQTKDVPCTRMLQFIKQSDSNRLNLIANMRSNDLIFGVSAVNIFNYTFLLEYFAKILNLEVGEYIHIANNFHYYERHVEMVNTISNITSPPENPIIREKSFTSLAEFDLLIKRLTEEEKKMRNGITGYNVIEFNDEFFDNWYQNLYKFNLNKKRPSLSYYNSILKMAVLFIQS